MKTRKVTKNFKQNVKKYANATIRQIQLEFYFLSIR